MTAMNTIATGTDGNGSLTRGSRMPHVRLRRSDGTDFDYGDVWQRRNLLLVALPSGEQTAGDAAWLEGVESARQTFETYEAAFVVTPDAVPGLPAPGVLVADRWGEVMFVETAVRSAELPTPAALAEWLRFVAHACPECEGEAR